MPKPTEICLLCLKKFSSDSNDPSEQSYQSRVLLPTSGLFQASPETSGNKTIYSRFVVWTQRYLKLNVAGQRLLDSGKDVTGDKGPISAFCDDCKHLVAYLLDLYTEWETVKLHLLGKVGELQKTMKLATKKISQKLRRSHIKTLTEQLHCKSARHLEFYRKAVIINCTNKVKKASPQLSIPRGLFPEEWKFSYQATKQSLMVLILIFALASPPRPKVVQEEAPRRRIGPRRKMVDFGAIASKVVGKKDGGDEEPPDVDGDDDEGLPDWAGGDDNDSDWSRGAASPGSPDSNPEDLENADPIPAKRRCLRKTRSKVKPEVDSAEENDDIDTEKDPDFKTSSKRSKRGNKIVPPKVTILPCKLCPKKFAHRRGLARHLRDIHNTHLDYFCEYCGIKCSTYEDMIYHKKRIHPGRAYWPQQNKAKKLPHKPANLPCTICSRKFVDARGLSMHMHQVHKSRIEYTCNQCGFKSKSAQENHRHRVQNHKKVRLRIPPKPRLSYCVKCNLRFNSKEELVDHRSTEHPKPQKKPEKTSTPEEILPPDTNIRFECPVCVKQISNDLRFKRHMLLHKNDSDILKAYHCECCGITLPTEQELSSHFSMEHQGIFSCVLCNQSYSTARFLRNHFEKEHETEQKTYFCYFCYRGYTTEIYWLIHRKIAHAMHERLFCEEKYCAEEFDTVKELNQHLAQHLKNPEEDKLFTCGRCEWSFLTEESLALHQLVHIPYETDLGYKCPVEECTEIYKLKDKLINHYKTQHHNGQVEPYECQECQGKFAHFHWFKTHLRLHGERNSGRKFTCEFCNLECVDSIQLAKHRLEKHKTVWNNRRKLPGENGEVVIRKRGRPKGWRPQQANKVGEVDCPVCQNKLEHEGKLRKHLEIEHESKVPEEEKQIQCHFCHVRFRWEETQRLHNISMHMQTHKFYCDVEGCEQHFDNCTELNNHLTEVHLEKEGQEVENDSKVKKFKVFYKCDKCGWLFASKEYYDLHLLNHTLPIDHLQYSCPVCEQQFSSLTRMKNHWNVEHGPNLKPYRCSQCPARFFVPAGLRTHFQRHERRKDLTPGEKLLCVDCGRQFVDIYLLNKHRKIHNPLYHVRCPEGCGEVCPDNERLRLHLRKVHGHGEVYPCDQCGTTFVYQHTLRKHIEWVHGAPKYECDICGQKYKRPFALKKHKQTHFPETRDKFVCAECGNVYKSEAGLQFHVASIHTPNELKRFGCPHCSYKTHRKMLFKGHLVTCLKNKGLPFDEQKYGKFPSWMRKEEGPKRKPGRKPGWSRKKKEEGTSEEEMEDKSTTEDEEEEIEEKVEVETTPTQSIQQPGNIRYPYQEQMASQSSWSSVGVVNAILANLTGIPNLTAENDREESRGQSAKKRGRPSKTAPVLTPAVTTSTSTFPATIDQHQFQSVASTSTLSMPQLFGNVGGGGSGHTYQSWLGTTSAGYNHHQQQQQVHAQHNQGGYQSPPAPVYSPEQPQNLHYPPQS